MSYEIQTEETVTYFKTGDIPEEYGTERKEYLGDLANYYLLIGDHESMQELVNLSGIAEVMEVSDFGEESLNEAYTLIQQRLVRLVDIIKELDLGVDDADKRIGELIQVLGLYGASPYIISQLYRKIKEIGGCGPLESSEKQAIAEIPTHYNITELPKAFVFFIKAIIWQEGERYNYFSYTKLPTFRQMSDIKGFLDISGPIWSIEEYYEKLFGIRKKSQE